jgi:hypothetical protein
MKNSLSKTLSEKWEQVVTLMFLAKYNYICNTIYSVQIAVDLRDNGYLLCTYRKQVTLLIIFL